MKQGVTWRKVIATVVKSHSHLNIIPTTDSTTTSPPSKQNIKNGPRLYRIVPHPVPAISIASFISTAESSSSSWRVRSRSFVLKSFFSCVFSSTSIARVESTCVITEHYRHVTCYIQLRWTGFRTKNFYWKPSFDVFADLVNKFPSLFFYATNLLRLKRAAVINHPTKDMEQCWRVVRVFTN